MNGQVQRETGRNITKFTVVSRFSREGKVAKMFWLGYGPQTLEAAVSCTVAHGKHNIWIFGSSDSAMVEVVKRIVEN